MGIAENGRERQARSVKSNSDYAPSRRATDELDSAQLEREEHTRFRVRRNEPAPLTHKVSHHVHQMSNRQRRAAAVTQEISDEGTKRYHDEKAKTHKLA